MYVRTYIHTKINIKRCRYGFAVHQSLISIISYDHTYIEALKQERQEKMVRMIESESESLTGYSINAREHRRHACAYA